MTLDSGYNYGDRAIIVKRQIEIATEQSVANIDEFGIYKI